MFREEARADEERQSGSIQCIGKRWRKNHKFERDGKASKFHAFCSRSSLCHVLAERRVTHSKIMRSEDVPYTVFDDIWPR